MADPDAGGIYEQVDGAIVLDGEVYLVEMKWTSDPIGTDLVSPHLVRVFNRGSCRGIFISASGYTEPAIHVIRQALQRIRVRSYGSGGDYGSTRKGPRTNRAAKNESKSRDHRSRAAQEVVVSLWRRAT